MIIDTKRLHQTNMGRWSVVMKREGEGVNRRTRAHLVDRWVSDVNGQTIVPGLIDIWKLIFFSYACGLM